MSIHNILIFRRLQACADLSARLYFFMTVFVYENAELFLNMYTTYGGNYLKIQESAENYLETILMLSEKQPYVRSIDIATELGFSKPSVSVAMKNLRINNLILVNDEGHITLTDEGRRICRDDLRAPTLPSPNG